ncbi:TPA: hypothetical protein RG862_003575 [Enterobacter ludwigii]|nr:hypothetical protein [Enterobacter ludwigii]
MTGTVVALKPPPPAVCLPAGEHKTTCLTPVFPGLRPLCVLMMAASLRVRAGGLLSEGDFGQ